MKTVDIYKISDRQRVDRRLSGINLIRLPELHYIVAEYYLTVEDQANATKYFDPVIESRGLVGFAKREGQKLALKHINNERRKEFIGEGLYFHVMKKYNMSAYEIGSDQTFKPSTEIYVFPIPDNETEYRD